MKLTANELLCLKELSLATQPLNWKRQLKAKGNKFVRLGLAGYCTGYPTGFVITLAGRAALEVSNA